MGQDVGVDLCSSDYADYLYVFFVVGSVGEQGSCFASYLTFLCSGLKVDQSCHYVFYGHLYFA